MASVVSIHRVTEKGAPAILLQTAHFSADFGLDCDWRSRKGRGRQITLIEEEALDRVASALKLGQVPPGASRRQVVVRGIRLNETIGKRLRVGPLLIDVHAFCEPCSVMETTIGRGAKDALKDCGGICGKVLEGGELRPGDNVSQVEGF